MIELEQEQRITYHSVTLGALTHAGDAIAQIDDNDEEGLSQTRALGVPAGLPGERVTIAVEAPPAWRATKGSRRRLRGKPRPPRVWITEIQDPSPLRVQAPCPIFGVCGGCQLQHMHYEAQLVWKRCVVEQLLREIGGFTSPPLLPTVPCADPWHYRNHMRFSVDRSGQPGLTARGSHRLLPLTACPIAHPYINTALEALSQQPNARPQVLIRCSSAARELLIQPHPQPQVIERLAIAGLNVCSESMAEVLAGARFHIRPGSFFQTNTAQAEQLTQMVLDGLLSAQPAPAAGAGVQPLTIVDAYCGVGTFALLLARHVAKVIAIEESASAIKDAQWNLREVDNVEILKGKVEELLPALAIRPDGLVIDPPRAGCQQVVLEALVQHPVAQVVYVSCDPVTLARDLNVLCHQHPVYSLHSLQPLDMFPQTAHIECIAVLTKISS